MKAIGQTLTESNCFYALYGLTDSVSELVDDFNNFVDPAGEAKWFNFIAYNPMHIFNNTSVAYE